MDSCGIYSITNKKTGQTYIGQSIHIERRFEQHKYNKKPITYIDRAINKYGADNFEFKILEECKPTELNKLEKKYIKKYNTYKSKNHYNLTSGGDSDYKTSLDSRKKISKAQFKRHNGEGTTRDINYLLNRYYAKDGFTEKKRVGEIWSPYHDTIAKREERTFARLDLLETIVNERKTKSRGQFHFTGTHKERARYLIKRISFNMGRYSAEQTVVMIIIYVKLESDDNARVEHYYPLLEEYDIAISGFIKFLVNLNRFHSQRYI